jgi:hypothetical protein
MGTRMHTGGQGGCAGSGGATADGGRRNVKVLIPSRARDLLNRGSIPAEQVPRRYRSSG